jgi:hypothetical protein
MPIKQPMLRSISSTLLITALFFIMVSAFSRFTRTALADDGAPYCKTIPPGCGSFGCNGNPGHYTCSLYAAQTGATCIDGGPCTFGPGGFD